MEHVRHSIIVDLPFIVDDLMSPILLDNAAATWHVQRATFAAVRYTFMGCYNDQWPARALPHLLQSDSNMNADMCYNLALAAGGFTLFGTQAGVQCWVGNSETRATMFGGATCYTPCNNLPNEMCGGDLVNSLYMMIQTRGDVQLLHACVHADCQAHQSSAHVCDV
jgi:hypothetical protein